jgi:hypothetical protein
MSFSIMTLRNLGVFLPVLIVLLIGSGVASACTSTESGNKTKETVTAAIYGSNPATNTGSASYTSKCIGPGPFYCLPGGYPYCTGIQPTDAVITWKTYSQWTVSIGLYYAIQGPANSNFSSNFASGTVGTYIVSEIVYNGCDANTTPFVRVTNTGGCFLAPIRFVAMPPSGGLASTPGSQLVSGTLNLGPVGADHSCTNT